MGRILTLAIIAIVVYVAYTQGLPWLKEALSLEPSEEVGGPGRGGGSRCVETAWRASEKLAGEVRHARPPVDLDAWGISYQEISRAIGTAEIECSSCLAEACRKAQAAVSELRGLALQFDDMARGDRQGMGNPAHQMERIHRLLNEARALAGL